MKYIHIVQYKHIFLFLISLYHILISPVLKLILGTQSMCRFTPTCSKYAEQVIKQYGIITGSMLFTKRFLTCQPFTKLSLPHFYRHPVLDTGSMDSRFRGNDNRGKTG